jgi:Na+/proline symporter
MDLPALGVAFAAIAIGALVPAAVMSIAAANLFTRNVWKEFVHPDCSDREESQVAKIVSLVVKVGALAFVLFLPTQFAIDLQLLGGVWMLQTLPAVMIALLTVILGDRGRADEEDETRAEDYDELEETGEPAPTVGAGVS